MEPGPDPRAALPIDWAEFVTRALASAAANAGGTSKILSGRPGSWEAARMREVLESTVGADDERLLEYRTEPVIAALRDKVDRLRSSELQSYADSLSAAITARLGQLNLDVRIHVTVGVAPSDADLRNGTTPLPGDGYYNRVDEAIAETPRPDALPGSPLERAEALD
jgi:hypothetical protein